MERFIQLSQGLKINLDRASECERGLCPRCDLVPLVRHFISISAVWKPISSTWELKITWNDAVLANFRQACFLSTSYNLKVG